jgi:MSHA type pilus biogenesis protein MshL
MRIDSIRRTTTHVSGTFTLLLAAACASSQVNKPAPYQVATVTAPPALPPAAVTPVQQGKTGGPPSMGPGQPAIVGTPSARINISANNEDVASVIGRLARQVGLTAIIDPAVRGPVTRSMQNVTLTDAMQSLVGGQYLYQVRNGALVVSPVQLVQHTYTVDYLAMSRVSSGATVVSRGTQGTNGSNNNAYITGAPGSTVNPNGGGPVSTGTDLILSSSQADIWGELTQQLESILFGTSSVDTTRTVGSTAQGPRGYTRCGGANGDVCLRISPLSSLVDVTATPDKQDEVSRYIALFTAAIGRQVSIKAQVVEVALDRSHSFGIDWQAVLSTARGIIRATANPGASFTTDPSSSVTGGTASFNLGVGDFTLQAVLNALQTVGDVQVVAKPTTNAMNQQKASFNVTRQEQFFTTVQTPVVSPTTGLPTGTFTQTLQIQTATVGLVFDVLPQISDKNVVMMAIRPSVTSIASRTQVVGPNGTIQATLPVTEHRETDTMARVRSGETIMIGGLIQKQASTTRSGIPLLMDIPILGRAFSSTKIEERNSELVIFLTPEIVTGQPPGSP